MRRPTWCILEDQSVTNTQDHYYNPIRACSMRDGRIITMTSFVGVANIPDYSFGIKIGSQQQMEIPALLPSVCMRSRGSEIGGDITSLAEHGPQRLQMSLPKGCCCFDCENSLALIEPALAKPTISPQAKPESHKCLSGDHRHYYIIPLSSGSSCFRYCIYYVLPSI